MERGGSRQARLGTCKAMVRQDGTGRTGVLGPSATLPNLRSHYATEFPQKTTDDLVMNRDAAAKLRTLGSSGALTPGLAFAPPLSCQTEFRDYYGDRASIKPGVERADPRANDSLHRLMFGRPSLVKRSHAKEEFSNPALRARGQVHGHHGGKPPMVDNLELTEGRATDFWQSSYRSEFGWVGPPRRRPLRGR